MKVAQLICLILLGSVSVLAQEVKFKKVSDEELLKTESSVDSEASAEYLFRSCKVEFEYIQRENRFEMIYTYFFRMKVYDDSNLDIGDRMIRYYVGGRNNNDEEIYGIEGYTYNMENGKVKKEKLNKKNIYDEEIDRYWSAKKFAMPGMKKGSVIDVKYKVKSPYVNNIKKMYFQQEYPVVYAKYESQVPEYFTYSNRISGFYPMQTATDSREDRIRIRQRDKKVDARVGADSRAAKQKPRDVTIPYVTNIKEFSAANIPPIQDELYVNNINNYRLGIGFELLSTRYPNSNTEYYSKNWTDIGNSYNESENFGDELKKDYEFDELLNGVSNLKAHAKSDSIFSYVRDSYLWNNYSTDVTKDGLKNLISSGSGNTAEINLLLVNLLRKSGLIANPVLMRNRYSGNLNINYPTRTDLNYVIAQVQLEGNVIYLDATDKNLTAGQLPSRAINRDGVLVTDEGGSQLSIYNSNKDITSKVQELNISGSILNGTYQEKYKRYSAYQLHSKFRNEQDFIDALEKSENMKFTSIEVRGLESNVGDVSLKAMVDYDNHVQEIDGKLFIDFALDILPKVSPFIQKERQFALFFDSQMNATNIIKYKIPKGYAVESLPENMNITLPNRMMMAVIQLQQMESEIVVTIRQTRKVDIISPEYYASVLEYFDAIVAKGNEKLVLSKI